MKNYIAPEMEVAKFNLSDVLTTSGNPAPTVGLISAGAITADVALPSDNGVTYVD